MYDPNITLSTIKQLGARADYRPLQQMINGQKQMNATIAEIYYQYHQALVELALIDDAVKICRKVLNTPHFPVNYRQRFALRYKLYEFTNDFLYSEIDNYFQYFRKKADAQDTPLFNKGIAYNCLSNVIKKGISSGQLNSLKKSQAIQLQKQSINYFRQDSSYQEYYQGLLQLAILFLSPPFSNPVDARKILERLALQVDQTVYPVLTAKIKMKLLELEWIDFHQHRIERPIGKFKSIKFDQLGKLFQQSGYFLGDLRVRTRQGILMLKYGYAEGLPILEDVIARYHQLGLVQLENNLWQKILDWYRTHGDQKVIMQIRNKRKRGASSFGKQLNSFTQELNEMEATGRSGKLDQSRLIFNAAKKKYGKSLIFHSFYSIWANYLQQVGQAEESLRIRKQQISLLSPLKISPILAEAYTQLAISLGHQNIQASSEALSKALHIYDQIGDKLSALSIIRQFIEVFTSYQRLTQGRLEMTPELESMFDQGFFRLQNQGSLKAVKGFGELLQTKGQTYLFVGDYQKCASCFAQAQLIFEQQQLHANLTFLYSQQALNFIQLADQTSQFNFYQQAVSTLKKAEKMTQKLNFHSHHWKVVYLIGISHYKAGQKVTDTQKQKQYWQIANCEFNRSYQLIEEQRHHLDSSHQQKREQAIISFFTIYHKVCLQGFNLNVYWALDFKEALKWLERMKSQALLDLFTSYSSEVQLPKQYDAQKVEQKSIFNITQQLLST